MISRIKKISHFVAHWHIYHLPKEEKVETGQTSGRPTIGLSDHGSPDQGVGFASGQMMRISNNDRLLIFCAVPSHP